MLSITVVHHKRQEAAGRRLVHEISLVDGFKASLWSEEHYKANEMKVTGRQPMVFIGPSKPALHIIPEMPMVYERHSTRAYLEGVRVVLVADVPALATADELHALESVLLSETQAILDGSPRPDRDSDGTPGTEVAVADDARVVDVVADRLIRGGTWAINRGARAAAVAAQYGYLSALFLADLLPQLGDQQ